MYKKKTQKSRRKHVKPLEGEETLFKRENRMDGYIYIQFIITNILYGSLHCTFNMQHRSRFVEQT